MSSINLITGRFLLHPLNRLWLMMEMEKMMITNRCSRKSTFHLGRGKRRWWLKILPLQQQQQQKNSYFHLTTTTIGSNYLSRSRSLRLNSFILILLCKCSPRNKPLLNHPWAIIILSMIIIENNTGCEMSWNVSVVEPRIWTKSSRSRCRAQTASTSSGRTTACWRISIAHCEGPRCGGGIICPRHWWKRSPNIPRRKKKSNISNSPWPAGECWTAKFSWNSARWWKSIASRTTSLIPDNGWRWSSTSCWKKLPTPWKATRHASSSITSTSWCNTPLNSSHWHSTRRRLRKRRRHPRLSHWTLTTTGKRWYTTWATKKSENDYSCAYWHSFFLSFFFVEVVISVCACMLSLSCYTYMNEWNFSLILKDARAGQINNSKINRV